jgi:PAS domain S-box-containing protein
MLNIMLVDDNDSSLSITKLLLTNSGYNVKTAINGMDALEKIRLDAPDIVISDVHMPVMDGFALCRELKKDDQFKSISFIFISSIFIDLPDQKLGLRQGAEAFILKTQEPEVFVGELKNIIQKCFHSGYKASMPDITDDTFHDDYILALNKKLQDHISRLEETNRRLLVSEEHYRGIVETANEGILTVDASSRISFVNPQLLKMLGYDPEEMPGLRLEQIISPEGLLALKNIVEKNKKGEGEKFERRLIRKDGSDLWMFISNKVLLDENGEFAGVLSMMSDITERKEMERRQLEYEQRLQQAQKMESIGTLAGGIAHDFNNILFPLIGFAEILKMDIPEDSPLQSHVDQILKAGFRSRRLVRQILTFSRQSDTEIKPMKLQPVIKEALELLRSSLPASITIEQDIDSACDFIKADPTQIHQVIMNLGTNAFHAMENTFGTLTVTLKQIESDDSFLPELLHGKFALLKIEDTGMGIEKNILSKMFEPYFTTKEIDKGTGLGLSVVQGIVKSHKGEIQAYSEPGKGTQIYVYLPILKKEEGNLNLKSSQLLPEGSEKILIVDGEKDIARLMQLILEGLGYETVTCTQSVKALEIFKASPASFDLILSDLAMPELSGAQLIKKIRDIRMDIPVIISTSFKNKETAKVMKELELQGLLKKPALKQDIAGVIRKVLDQAQGRK